MHPQTSATSARRRARHVTVFLDVDGVLNSYPVEPERFKRERRRAVRAWLYELHFRPKIIKGLEHLVDQQLADIVWLSTWSQRCRSEVEPALSFKHSYPTIDMPDGSFNRYANDPHAWWKARAVEDWLADHPHDRAVWIDDDLAAPVTREYFHEKYGDRLLLVAPDFARGLSEDHLERIRSFTYARPSGTPPRRFAPPPRKATPDGEHPRWRRILHLGTYSGDNSGADTSGSAQAGKKTARKTGARAETASRKKAGKHTDTGTDKKAGTHADTVSEPNDEEQSEA